MKFTSALLAATVLAAPVAALAAPLTGPYVSLGAGVNIFQSQSINRFTVPDAGIYGSGGRIKSDADILGSAAVGYGLGNGFRVEIQGDYRRNGLTNIGGLNASGSFEQYSIFGNVLYDFDLNAMGIAAPGITPYAGLGVGYGQVKFQNGAASAPDTFIRLTGTRGDLAVQGILGLSYDIASVPGLAVTAEYRFTAIPENLTYAGQYFAPGLASRLNVRTDGAYSHAGVFGVRYALWQPAAPVAPAVVPPPPPPPPPAVEAPRTYLVFFDWDRADLSARARQIVAEAAAASTKVQTTRIEVNGYTDLSGTAAYNQRLSVRRAKAVEAELVKDGVPANEIAIHGYGESNPLVPTAKGVREPQNRRVEIILK